MEYGVERRLDMVWVEKNFEGCFGLCCKRCWKEKRETGGGRYGFLCRASWVVGCWNICSVFV